MPTKASTSRFTKVAQSPIVLSGPANRTRKFLLYTQKIANDRLHIEEYLNSANQSTVWVSDNAKLLYSLVKYFRGVSSSIGTLVTFHPIEQKSWPTLDTIFKHVASITTSNRLPDEEFFEVLSADNKGDLFIGGNVDHTTKMITLWRGDLKPLNVPFSAFKRSGNGIRPDFNDLGIKDYGQTIRLGEYEAAADAILYEFDPEYRRLAKKNHIASEESFGASLRRLRILRGLKRDGFPQLSPKTIGRIERGETEKDRIHQKTLKAIADRLSVLPEDIEEY